MKNNQKSKLGFTLVELLAVIVILAVILAIAIPTISNITNASTKNAFESDAKMLLQQLEYKKLENDGFDEATFTVDLLSSFNLSKDNYSSLGVSTIDNKPYIVIEGKNKWQGLKACGTRTNMKIVPITDTTTCENVTVVSDYDTVKGVNKPKLATGMKPIKWNGTNWEDTTESDADWYDYNTKKWANARTADGSMWVWIPRYIYKISSGWHSSTTGTINVQFSKEIDDNWNNSVIGNIDTGTTSNSSNNKWTNHPAFTFGGTELTGIWVAKFEATAAEGIANGYTSDGLCPINGDNVTTKTIRIVPNVQSWRCIDIGNMFDAIRNMETKSTYGWAVASGLQANGSFTTDTNNIDAHLMKNTEWGAVAYLSKSTYGQNNNEIWINNSQQYITGCAGNSVSADAYNGCQNTYETTGGIKASTTGNIYGIYDMSGGAWEYTASYVDNGSDTVKLRSSIINASGKFKDVYAKGSTDNQVNNYGLSINKKGDAVYETSGNVNGSYSWFGDNSNMPETDFAWFVRGGAWCDRSNAGAFYFASMVGQMTNYLGFRPVLLVGSGL